MGEKKSEGNGCLIAIILVIVIGFFSMLGDSGSNYSSTMSKDYNTNSTYQKNVDDIAKTYDMSPEEVDKSIQDVTK